MSKQKNMNIDQLLKAEGQKTVDKMLVWVLAFALAVIPLLTRTAIFEFQAPLITGTSLDSGVKAEVYTYYKFIWLIIVVIVISCLFLYKMIAKAYEIPKSYIHIPLAIMFVFLLASGLFADYKTLSMFGQYNRHEGTITYIGYLVLFFVAANILYNEKSIKTLVYALTPLLLANAFLGLAYFFGYDVLKNAFFRGILLPAGLTEESIGAGAYFNSTINNPNYVSGIAGVLTVLFLTKAVFAKVFRQRVFDLVLAAVAFAMLLASLSTSGFVTFVVLLPFIVVAIFFSGKRKQASVTLISGLVLFSLIFVGMYSYNSKVWDESIGFFVGKSKNRIEEKTAASFGWKELYEAHTPFAVNKVYAANESSDEFQEFQLPPAQWSAGTGRVYIWSETLKLIEKRPLLGYGMDTYPYYFPQDDPNKNSGINNANTIVDKPHNMYLNLAYGAGFIALAAFLVLIVRYLWYGIRTFKERINTEESALFMSIFLGLCAYLVQGMFNDSIIGTAFIFWIFLGVGVSMLRKKVEG
ncbi:O-antigen ligase family protein [Aneurinibacillus thermoaerophilus]|uniref:O-antigen ligase family protein n=1 Tax=Aneurinibacillus thermoaerophilus TaxID=143495 RepID=UPI002E246FBA|nr:O-antigen ligase family protein [Aneurinibacillus thermoaerophilus]